MSGTAACLTHDTSPQVYLYICSISVIYQQLSHLTLVFVGKNPETSVFQTITYVQQSCYDHNISENFLDLPSTQSFSKMQVISDE